MSSATSLASGFAVALCLASTRAHPPESASLNRPHRPLGSPAVIATLASIGLAPTFAQSPCVKLSLCARVILPLEHQPRKPSCVPNGNSHDPTAGAVADQSRAA